MTKRLTEEDIERMHRKADEDYRRGVQSVPESEWTRVCRGCWERIWQHLEERHARLHR